MAEASIPVDLLNPGQVFACLGLLEAADVLLGQAEGYFDWSTPGQTRFRLSAAGGDPVAVALGFLAEARVSEVQPVDVFPAPKPVAGKKKGGGEKELLALPVLLSAAGASDVSVSHWADGSSREPFKLYSGNRSAATIAMGLLRAVSARWRAGTAGLEADPFVLAPVAGTFNFDARRSWTAIDAGYSPNDQKHWVMGSAAVDLLAAWGLENARPAKQVERTFLYWAWGARLPPPLARAAMGGNASVAPLRRFLFGLSASGKNKVVGFAVEEEEWPA